jgi:hypothetical protein
MSRQLRMRLGVSDRQHRAGHARNTNPLGGGPRSYPAASGTADQAWLQELPALTLASPGRRWMAQHSSAGGPRPCGVAAKTRHRGLMALGGSSRATVARGPSKGFGWRSGATDSTRAVILAIGTLIGLLVSQLATILHYTTRQALQQALDQRSGGRLRLDPPTPRSGGQPA